mgnify:CR=1 FL=1
MPIKQSIMSKNQNTEDLLVNISQKLVEGNYLRRNLPEGGKLLVDRHLPFLCVYRFNENQKDENIAMIVKGQASHLVISNSLRSYWRSLTKAIVHSRLDVFDAFLLLEIWPQPIDKPYEDLQQFKIFCPTDKAQSTIQVLKKGLENLRVLLPEIEVVKVHSKLRGPVGLPPLIKLETGKELGLLVLGLEIPPVYLDPVLKVNYPLLLQKIRRSFNETIKKTVFEFIQVQTSSHSDISHYLMLGSRELQPTVQFIDKKLVQIHESLNFLMEVTPVNMDRAFLEFKKNNFEKKPRFNYRLIATNPDLLKRELYQIPMEQIEDVTFSFLLKEKRNEMDIQISMIEARNTKNFLYNSLRIYGGVEKSLYNIASKLLSSLPPSENGQLKPDYLDANEFAERSTREIAFLHQKNTGFNPKIEIRKDTSGLMVSQNRLLIGANLKIAETRVEALLQHEIGTHLLTHFNGSKQPLQLLMTGLAGYEEMQEGLAVLAEYLVGGLSKERIRVLAARVIGVHAMIEGADFIETFQLLHRKYHFDPFTAFQITTRIFRGGGLTKDAVYLRGLVKLLEILSRGISFDHLFVGKVGFKQIHYVDELLYRKVLTKPLVLPKYLMLNLAIKRLRFIQEGAVLFDLINPKK